MRHALWVGLIAAACQSPPEAPYVPAQSPPPLEESFFDESALLEGSVALEATPCVGDGDTELRGQVAAPFGRLAHKTLWDWLVPSAHAAALPGEQTVANVDVSLGRVAADWRPTSAYTTRTDALGRFCFRLPRAEFDAALWMVHAHTNLATLRRVVLDARDVNVHLASETLVRLVEAHNLGPQTPRARLINLDTLVGTNLELLVPVQLTDGTRVEDALQTTLAQVQADARIAGHLKGE